MKLSLLLSCVLALTVTALAAQTTTTEIPVANTFPSTVPGLQPNLDLSAFARHLNKYLSEKSGSTMVVKPTTPLPPSAALSYVASGRVPMAWTQSSSFTDKEFGFLLLGQAPFVSAERYLEWRADPATVIAADALYAKYGVKAMPCSVVDSNMDFLLRKLPDGDYQFRGAKVAMTGPFRDVYTATGIVPMALPFGELRNVLNKGLVDGAYAWTPHESIELALYESTGVLYFPSQVRSFFVIDLLLSPKFWNDLQAQERTAIEMVCGQLIKETLVSSRKYAADAVEKYKKASIPVLPLPDQEVAAMRAAWNQIAGKRATFDPAFEALFKSLYGRQP